MKISKEEEVELQNILDQFKEIASGFKFKIFDTDDFMYIMRNNKAIVKIYRADEDSGLDCNTMSPMANDFSIKKLANASPSEIENIILTAGGKVLN